MIVHHSQAVKMADTVRDRTKDPVINVLAIDILLSQQAEIGQMQGWLEAWDLPANGSEPAMAGIGHPTTGPMPAMATPEELARLQQASPEDADELFLQLMIPHHQAALPMANAILKRSNQPEVVGLANKVLSTQQAEIRARQALLERKGLSSVEDEPSLPSSDEGSVSDSAPDAARLAPVALAVLAAAWLTIDAIRRWWRPRRARAALLAGSLPTLPTWRMVAVGGLMASAILHIGLAPAPPKLTTAPAILFSAAGVAVGATILHITFFAKTGIVAAICAAASLAWPSGPAYLAKTGISLALTALWGLFLLMPLPGADVAESFAPVQLFATVAELVAAAACIKLWFRPYEIHGSEYSEAQPEVLLYMATAFSLVAALIHLWVLPEYFKEWWGYGTFFLVTALAQGLYGMALLCWWPRRSLLLLGIAGNLLAIVLYLVTHTIGIPFFGPHAGEMKGVEAIDVGVMMSELGLVGILVGVMLVGVSPKRVPDRSPKLKEL
jgi:uncharacterized protein (DUF305 family)